MELTNTVSWVEVPAQSGRAVRLASGDHVRLIDVEGGQVGDVFAFSAAERTEHLSASHTRTATSRLFPRIGQHFMTNQRRPILTLVDDTSPGVHDMLIAACDPARYQQLGASDHASCAENLRKVLRESGFPSDIVPQPVNVFMNIPVAGDDLDWLPAETRPGDAVTFEAAMDCLFVVSACPMDLNSINGEHPTPLAIEITPSKSRFTQED